MPLRIIRNDISKVSADAIVNSANPKPICGGGAEFHIYEAAGHAELLAAREKIGPLDVAEIAVTPAFALNAKYIIHTVGPVWNGGKSGEFLVLANCYRGALEKAKELDCTSIAFPLISSGVYRFPKDSALKIALTSINEFLQANEMDVMLVVFDRKAFEVSEELSDDIQSFINDNYVQDKRSEVLGYVHRRWNARNTPRPLEFDIDEAVETDAIFETQSFALKRIHLQSAMQTEASKTLSRKRAKRSATSFSASSAKKNRTTWKSTRRLISTASTFRKSAVT